MCGLARSSTAWHLPVGILLEWLGNVQHSHPPSDKAHAEGKVHPQSPGPMLQEHLPHRRNITWRLAKLCHTPRCQRCIVKHLKWKRRRERMRASRSKHYDAHGGRRRETPVWPAHKLSRS